MYSRSARFVTCPAVCCSGTVTPTVLILTAETSSWPNKRIKISYLQGADCCFLFTEHSTRSVASENFSRLIIVSIILRIRETVNLFSADIPAVF